MCDWYTPALSHIGSSLPSTALIAGETDGAHKSEVVNDGEQMVGQEQGQEEEEEEEEEEQGVATLPEDHSTQAGGAPEKDSATATATSSPALVPWQGRPCRPQGQAALYQPTLTHFFSRSSSSPPNAPVPASNDTQESRQEAKGADVGGAWDLENMVDEDEDDRVGGEDPGLIRSQQPTDRSQGAGGASHGHEPGAEAGAGAGAATAAKGSLAQPQPEEGPQGTALAGGCEAVVSQESEVLLDPGQTHDEQSAVAEVIEAMCEACVSGRGEDGARMGRRWSSMPPPPARPPADSQAAAMGSQSLRVADSMYVPPTLPEQPRVARAEGMAMVSRVHDTQHRPEVERVAESGEGDADLSCLLTPTPLAGAPAVLESAPPASAVGMEPKVAESAAGRAEEQGSIDQAQVGGELSFLALQ
jgi:hypothetical protein